MPELPEVETIRKDLAKKIIGKKMIKIEICQKKSIRNSPAEFIRALENKSLESIDRKGKLLIFKIKENKKYLLIHLRMTGQLLYYKSKRKAEKKTRVIFNFNDSSQLFFNDTRRFGYLQIVIKKAKNKILEKMGVDLLDKNFTFERLKELSRNKKRLLKSFLLDQKMIAGIGNIYADEICFNAKLRPDRTIGKLSDKGIKKLYNSIIKIIKLAIKNRGTSFSDYIDSSGKKGQFSKFLKVYQKEKEICQNCHQRLIKKIKVAGRATRYCKNCQK